MNDFKSKLPDFKELTAMTKKLFTGLKSTVDEIIDDYQKKREEQPVAKTEEQTTTTQSRPSDSPVVSTPPVNSPSESPLVTPREVIDGVDGAKGEGVSSADVNNVDGVNVPVEDSGKTGV